MSETHKLKLENWSAVPGFIGDLTLGIGYAVPHLVTARNTAEIMGAFHAPDVPTLTAGAFSLMGEVTLFKSGHTAIGLSAGWGFIAVSDLIMRYSPTISHDWPTQLALGGGAVVFGVGTLRYPIGELGKAFKECVRECSSSTIQKHLHKASQLCLKVAVKIKPLVGTAGAAIQIPLFAASYGHNSSICIASAFWMASDLMAGRTQKLFSAPLRYIKASLSSLRNAPSLS